MNGSDGSLIIDTELDNSGFDKGTDKLLKAIGDLSAEVKRFGTEVQKSFSSAISLLRGISSTTDAIFENMGQQAQQATAAQMQFVQATGQARQAVSGLADAESSYDAAMAKVQKKIDAQKAKLSEYYRAQQEIQASTDESLTHAATDDQAARVLEIEEIQLAKLNEKYASQLEALHELEAEYSRLAAAKEKAGSVPAYSAEDLKTVSADIERASKAIDGYEAKIEKMRSVGASDNAWKSVQYDIQRANASLSAYRANLDSLQAEGKIKPEDYERLSTALETASAKARELSESLTGVSRQGQPFSSVLKGIAQNALVTAKNIARISFRAMRNGFSSVSNSVKRYISNAQQARFQSNALVKAMTSLKRLMITRIKRMFISEIFNGVKEGLQNLAQFSSSFNSAMSNIKNSSKQLTANISAALGGLIEKLEPVITGFINMLSKAISYVNAFFGVMQGKSTMIVAKKQTDSYAQSVQKAAEKQKELNRQVYGFDELNKRTKEEEEEEEDDQDGNPLFEEVPIDDLPDNIKDFLKELKDLWDNEDYFGFGHKLAEALNEAMQKADDWINNVFRPMGVKWAGIIAEVLNGLVDGFDADLFGKLVADSLNAVADIINTFLTKFNWERLGEKVGEAIRSFFTNIDWELIGKTFANGWNALIDTIHGIVTTPGMWKAMGDAIGGFIATWFSNINFQKMGDTIAAGFNGVFTAIQAFTDQIKAKGPEFSKNLSEGINNMISGIDWAGAGRTLSDCVTTLLGTILDVARKTDWQAIGRGIGEFLSNIEWGTIFAQVGEIIWTALKGVIDGLFDTKSGKVVLAIGAGILAIKGLFSAVEMAATVSTWINAIGGALPTLLPVASSFVSSLGSILGAIGSVIFSPQGLIIMAIVAAAALIITHWDEIKEAAAKLRDSVLAAWESLKTNTVQKWNDLKTATATAWNNIKTEVTTKFEAVKTSVKTTVDNVKTTMTTAWTTLKTEAMTKWKEISNTIKTNFEAVKQPVKTVVDNVKKTITDAWDTLSRDARTKWDNIKRDITQPMSEIQRNMSNAWDSIKRDVSYSWENIRSTIMDKWNSIKSAIGSSARYDWQGIGSQLVEGLRNGISRAWSGLTSWVSNLMSGLTGLLNRIFRIGSPSKVWAEIGEYLDLGLMKGLKDAQGGVLSTVSNMAKDINDEMELEDAVLSVGPELKGTTSELYRVAGILSNIAGAFQRIHGMLSDMGGLSIPDLVSGAVVPVRTAVSGDSADAFGGAQFSSFTSDLDERLFDQRELLERILDAILKKRGLDADELASAISLNMSNAIRGYGGV